MSESVRVGGPFSADRIKETIVREIVSGHIPPGTKLMTERELVRRFGTGRHVVRQALTALESEGWIVRHVGRGTFVAQQPGEGRPDALGDASPAEIVEARLLLEPELVRLAVTNATAADFARIQECLRRSHSAHSHDEFEHWDAALHRAIVQATHNTALIRMAEAIHLARQAANWGKLKRSTNTPHNRATYDKQHRAIVEAVCERDGELASERMREHLRTVRTNMLGN